MSQPHCASDCNASRASCLEHRRPPPERVIGINLGPMWRRENLLVSYGPLALSLHTSKRGVLCILLRVTPAQFACTLSLQVAREKRGLGHISQKQNAEPHPRPTARRRGAKKPRTGLRHRPEKGGASATSARRSKSVASAPNPRTEAMADVSFYLSPGPGGRSRPLDAVNVAQYTVVIPARRSRPPGRPYQIAPRASSGG